MSRKVLLIDEEYGTFGGHHASYDLPICEELHRRDIPFRLLASSELTGETVSEIVPVFHTRAALRFRLPGFPRIFGRIASAAAGNFITCLDLFRKVTNEVSRGDILVLCRPLARTRLAYAIWLRYLAIRSCLVTVVYVVHNEPEPWFGSQMRILMGSARPHVFQLVAHSIAVANLVRERIGLVPALLPLPFNEIDFIDRRGEGFPIEFAFLGLGHRSKGLDLVLAALNDLTDLLADGKIRFTIQSYLPFVDTNADALQSEVKDLPARYVSVEVIDRELAPDEYVKELQCADVLLVPHRLETYRYALSGVFSDAMSSARPVIVADGSYMSDLVRQSGAGLTFESGDAHSLALAIRTAVAGISELRERAIAVRQHWKNEHGPEAFVSCLMSLAK